MPKRIMQVSDNGILEIAEHEGIVPAPYKDSVGVWTFGIGHTSSAGAPDPEEMSGAMPEGVAFDEAISSAIRIFRSDVRKFEDRVNDAIQVPLKQHEFDALVSFDFNTGGIHRAKLTKAINRRNPNAAHHFMGWLRPPEIRKRRTAEMRLFQTGDYDANGTAIPIWKTDGRGRLTGVHSQMDGRELLTRMQVDRNPKANPSWFSWIAEIIGRLITLR